MTEKRGPMHGKTHSEESKKLMAKRKQGQKIIHNGAGECRIVSEADAHWMVMAEGWHYGRGRKKPLRSKT